MMPDLKRKEPTRSPSHDNVLSSEELRDLRRHRNRTIGAFVAICIYMFLVFGAVQFLDLSEGTERILIGVLFAAVIPMLLLQFSKRCPKCRVNLGWQVRLGIPENCKKCGVRLSDEKKPE